MGKKQNECNRLIGGLWLPVRTARHYFEVRCNMPEGHLFGNCAFLDEKGGTIVTSTGQPGTRIVNQRGWVTELAEG